MDPRVINLGIYTAVLLQAKHPQVTRCIGDGLNVMEMRTAIL
jgi:hypothetical protein